MASIRPKPTGGGIRGSKGGGIRGSLTDTGSLGTWGKGSIGAGIRGSLPVLAGTKGSLEMDEESYICEMIRRPQRSGI